MKRFIYGLILSVIFSTSVQAAVLVFSNNGIYVTKTDPLTATISADTVGKDTTITTSFALTSNLNVPATQNFTFANGAKIKPNGHTFTYVGSIERWPENQVFDMTGGGSVSLRKSKPEHFGNITSLSADCGTSLNYAFSSSSDIELAARTYLTSIELNIGADTLGNKVIHGAGDRLSVIKATAAIDVLKLNYSGYNMRFRDFAIDGNDVATYGMWIGNGTTSAYHDIQGVAIYKCKTAGLYLNAVQYSNFKDMQITNCYNGSNSGIGIHQLSGSVNKFDHVYCVANNIGMHNNKSNFISMYDCGFYGPGATTGTTGVKGIHYMRFINSSHFVFNHCYWENEISFSDGVNSKPLILFQTPDATFQTTDFYFNDCNWQGINSYNQDLIFIESGCYKFSFKNCQAIKPNSGYYIINNQSPTALIIMDNCQRQDSYYDTRNKQWDAYDDSAVTGVKYTMRTMHEEGTWTPDLKFGGGVTGITYGAREGKFTRRGDIVDYSGFIILTNKGISTGVAEIYGLPFAPVTDTASNVTYHSDITTSAAPWQNSVTALGNKIVLRTTGASSVTAIDNTAFANTSRIDFSGSYRIADMVP